ncbi:uncharacterized protein LOC128977189, partial [Indicator indicator]|uniref:uncharacterized protein LOC128977189 n=1 Tax=Indicator indicator TaxID=1002788 RepID=UPI0023DEEFE1
FLNLLSSSFFCPLPASIHPAPMPPAPLPPTSLPPCPPAPMPPCSAARSGDRLLPSTHNLASAFSLTVK